MAADAEAQHRVGLLDDQPPILVTQCCIAPSAWDNLSAAGQLAGHASRKGMPAVSRSVWQRTLRKPRLRQGLARLLARLGRAEGAPSARPRSALKG